MSTHHQPPVGEAEISDCANQLWQIAGGPAGRDLEFWLAAETELKRDREATARTADERPNPDYMPTKKRTPVRRKTGP